MSRKKLSECSLEELLIEIVLWSGKYEFSFQFWGEDKNNVYINKDHVELFSGGGFASVHEALCEAIGYVRKINPCKNKPLQNAIKCNKYIAKSV